MYFTKIDTEFNHHAINHKASEDFIFLINELKTYRLCMSALEYNSIPESTD